MSHEPARKEHRAGVIKSVGRLAERGSMSRSKCAVAASHQPKSGLVKAGRAAGRGPALRARRF